MKLLGWMHRKFRQNGGDPFMDFSTGNPCGWLSGVPSMDDHNHQAYSSKHSKHPGRPISDLRTLYPDKDDHEDPPIIVTDAYDNFFNGLLTIGTLGLPTLTAGITNGVIVNTEDGTATPTFGIPPLSVDDITEKEEHTEVDLMVINSELENLLVVPESDPRISSARASHVSMKQLVVTNNSTSSCPLQEYLLGSNMDVGETTTEQKKEHRRQRSSLGELFMVEKGAGGGGSGGGTSKKEKPLVKVQSMVKKILKRHGSGTYCSGGGGDDDDRLPDGHDCNSQTNNKFHKIIQMFHKKIHPENSVAATKAMKAKKIVTKLRDGCGETGGGTAAASGFSSDGTLSPVTASVASESSESNGNREQWIKTDADYLVLEL